MRKPVRVALLSVLAAALIPVGPIAGASQQIPEAPPEVTAEGNGKPRKGNLYEYCWTTYSLPFIVEECSGGSLIALKSTPMVALDEVTFSFDYAVKPESVSLRYWDRWRRLSNTPFVQVRGKSSPTALESELSLEEMEPGWSASWDLGTCRNCYVLLRVEWPDLQAPTGTEWASYWFRVERSFATPTLD